jgi:hypothetical protein
MIQNTEKRFNASATIEQWIVPVSGTYRILTKAAQVSE